MVIPLIAIVIFGGIVAVALLYAGIARLYESVRDGGKFEGIFWGIFGIGAGLGMGYWIFCLFTAPPQ